MCWFFGIGCRWGPGKGAGLDPGGVGRRGLSIELWTPGLDAGVGPGVGPGFGPGAGERVGRPKRRPGQLGGRTVGWAAGRPNGRVKEWKGWQGRTEKDGNGKGPGPSGSRSVKGSFGQPLRSAKGPVKGPVRPNLGPPEFLPERVAPRQVPTRPSLGLSRVRSVPPPVAKGLFRQGLGLSRVRSVTLPRSAKGRSVKVPARPGLGPSKVRSARASARRSSSPRESHPVKSRPVRVSACRGFVRSLPRSAKGLFHQGPGSSGARPVKGPVRPSLGSPEFLPGRVAPPLHVRVPTAPFPLSSPFMSSSSPLPLRAPLTPPTPRPSILRSGAAEPQGPRFDRRGWNRPSQDVERDFGCGAESCRRVGGSVAEASV